MLDVDLPPIERLEINAEHNETEELMRIADTHCTALRNRTMPRSGEAVRASLVWDIYSSKSFVDVYTPNSLKKRRWRSQKLLTFHCTTLPCVKVLNQQSQQPCFGSLSHRR
jgi:hypothetical protein